MSRNHCISIFISILLWVLTGCKTTEENSIIELISAREYYPSLLEEAQRWQADAYLDNMYLYLDPTSNLLRAHFLSPSAEYESLGVDLLQDGTLKTEIFTYDVHVYHHAPILESDWQIDSQDALNLILEKTNHAYIDFSQVTNYLKLERFRATESQPVVWHLALIYNLGETSEHYYLDAVDGELLQLPQTIPTQITTFTP